MSESLPRHCAARHADGTEAAEKLNMLKRWPIGLGIITGLVALFAGLLAGNAPDESWQLATAGNRYTMAGVCKGRRVCLGK